MKTATVLELCNRYTQLLKWIEAGEEIRITRRGVVIARLVPENPDQAQPGVAWTKSAGLCLGPAQFASANGKAKRGAP
jgi:antitoxin (DNA-binding transcriptional repressor) of toxin-antitoxin stability system